MHVGDWMDRGAAYWPDRLAVVDPRTGRFTYADMARRANGLARWLSRQGVQKGARVALLALNGVEVLDALFACAKLGAIFVPLNWRLHPVEVAQALALTTPAVLLYGEDFAAAAERGELPRLSVDGPAYREALQTDGAPVETELSPEDTLCLLFTGGTTGAPKAARISYRMVAWNTLTTMVHEVRPGDVTLTHTPMFHTGGLFVYTLPLLSSGGTVVLLRRWDPERMLELVEQERVTLFFCVPTQYQQLLDAPRFARTDFSQVRFLTSGGAPLPVSLLERWRAVHDVPFKQGFGMTEFGPGVFSMGAESAIAKAGSIGRPNLHVEARLVGDDGHDVATGEVGELWLRGPAMCSGYFANEEATRAAIDSGGWFHTGDLARRDADGFFFIVDRKKDMFISGGENVYPAELEAALHQHPAVALCAVVGVPDARWGEVGKAFVVLREGHDATEESLLEFLRTRIARYKLPKSVELRKELPLSPAGKILKRALR